MNIKKELSMLSLLLSVSLSSVSAYSLECDETSSLNRTKEQIALDSRMDSEIKIMEDVEAIVEVMKQKGSENFNAKEWMTAKELVDIHNEALGKLKIMYDSALEKGWVYPRNCY